VPARTKIILIGGGPHAEVVADIVEKEGRFDLVGITDTRRSVGDRFLDYAVIGRQDELETLLREHGVQGGIVAIGDNHDREKVAALVRQQLPGFEFVTAIHPSASIARDVDIGEGSVVAAGCVVSVGARIGRFGILNTRSSLEHGGEMGDFSSIAAGVTTGGFFRLGRSSALANGVTTVDRIAVGDNSVVGAGSLVLGDIGDDVLAHGSPARVVRRRVPGERFLR